MNGVFYTLTSSEAAGSDDFQSLEQHSGLFLELARHSLSWKMCLSSVSVAVMFENI